MDRLAVMVECVVYAFSILVGTKRCYELRNSRFPNGTSVIVVELLTSELLRAILNSYQFQSFIRARSGVLGELRCDRL